ncbi:hypothetical protein BBJ29_006370 [Phytophthora kernoviae]|uniref:WRKY19-like zinc finger domain-containing protein n=1 Tax=Phytophthora kernoviae TaxID=325452 RepID=A0A3F2RG92_9STRA|nr:hypothetical protein BBJ29_006370 [Phytophthora kernoviae]RLN56186.1 hypothetical protein BBP00_00008136 [Phytophthora kernoviae]
MCKADISFLLNPAGADKPDFDVKLATPPISPSMSLFQRLSPVMQNPEPSSPSTPYQHRLIASCIAPREKRFNSLHETFTSGDEMSEGSSTPTTEAMPRARKTHSPPCQIQGCKNLAVSRGCCVRHGGGSKCTTPGCNKRAKLYQRCFQHGGYKMCTEPGCTKKAKRYGHCWSHGGGHICEAPTCTKVSTQGGFCWAHGGGNRCKHEGCNRRSYQKFDYYCLRHAPRSAVENANTTTVTVSF